ncbi:MAG: phosphoribosylglycinamide formyltransferase [Mycoplasmataceae bacterium]|jgi:phosphoribosylglycinamide formyltransferase-1|nr:phosphoribosylglycinamide formyltransferase [Mycoplasmataceae bacterium]
MENNATKIAVLVSGGGSNLQSIIDAIKHKELDATIELVISSNSKAYALERAKQHNIKSYVVSKKDFSNPSDEILKIVNQHHVELIILAGYLGILNGRLLNEYQNKIINIHPALLPKFGGAGMYGHHVHEAVIKANEHESGATVHYVDEKVDGGNIILQVKVPVLNDDTPDALAKRVLEQEHKILPKAIKLTIAKLHSN